MAEPEGLRLTMELQGGTSTFETISATGGNGAARAGDVANGSCSSADATLRKLNTKDAIPFLANGTTARRPRALGTSAEAWSISSIYSPGVGGLGGLTTSGGQSGAGAVGGAVLLLY